MVGDHRARFTPTVSHYRAWRPDYPAALFDWLLEPPGIVDVVDLGSGTGITARQLAARGLRVTGIEPNEAMRGAAGDTPGVSYRPGEAAVTGLPDACCDLVTVGQAFHWFDPRDALPEIRRILRPGGHGCAFWNLRAGTAAMTEYDALIKRYSTEYGRVPRARDVLPALRAERGAEEATFPHQQHLSHEGLRGRAWSSSYVARGVADTASFDAGLDELFARHARDGIFTMTYETRAVRWT